MIRHVLLDADGVLQRVPGGGQLALARPLLGASAPEILERLFALERASLRGESDFRADLRAALAQLAPDVDASDLYARLWLRIDPDAAVLDLARRLRTAGYGVHLGTNQHRQRAAYMREELGYDELFDVGCYSCELGAAKPEPAFFEQALGRVGARADEVVFVDDKPDNVVAARVVGLAAEQWDLARPVADLVALLAGHGVDVS